MRPLIELQNITKQFPGVLALDKVSFTLERGEIHALCGENGAGKSTLIKVMTGAHEMDKGEYIFDGDSVHFKSTHEGINRGVSCVYQELSIVPEQDVAKNLFIGNLPMKGSIIDYKKLYSESKKILNELGMDVSPKSLAGDLSVGQQQMIEIGRALTRNARCIIMDEPTSSLSESETDTLLKIIFMLKKKDIAIVYISHKLDEVMHLSDRITVIRDGQNIVTVNKNEITEEELIANMIGRNLENMYNKKEVTPGKSVLEVNNLSSKDLFNNISFSVRAGEIVGFFGLVGAGRSEIMRAIFGADKYNSGEVIMNSNKLRKGSPSKSIKAGIGFCTEDRKKEGLMLQLSILMNMTIVKLKELTFLGVIKKSKQQEITNHYIDSIRIKTPSANQKTGNLSGGNQQKVVLAKWLMMNPDLLIIDEPTRGIDIGAKAEIYTLLGELAKQGMAIIVVSSEIEEVMGLSDKVITIHEGDKTAEFNMKDDPSREQILTAALGAENI
ncbi:MAG: sugar ABC transporter ATP-binding protein [Spirochaetales bacterium]|nr:sugar ABC transporter ATP-binding protein [Spirochaetales bacterium]